MTTTITVTNPEGIILGADSRISLVNPNTNQILSSQDNVRKIFFFNSCKVGVSYWGLVEIISLTGSRIPMITFLRNFEQRFLEPNDSVQDVANKLKVELESIRPGIRSRVGFHVTGFMSDDSDTPIPHLRHVFHDSCHREGEFENENCHEEYHLNCEKIVYADTFFHPVLFNGDNSIANCLFNFIPQMRHEIIRNDLMSIRECIDLIQIILSMSIQRLDYYFNLNEERIPHTIGGPTFILLIKPNGESEWIPENDEQDQEET